jgi:NAD-dependent dihydropyrimidine dehydrogenase PreA subunit
VEKSCPGAKGSAGKIKGEAEQYSTCSAPASKNIQQVQGELEMAYVIAEPCIGTKDTACVDACPVDCIHPKKDEAAHAESEQLFIDPVECIDCGACVPVCPVSAIYAADDLPEKWAAFAEKNAAHYGR